MMLDEEVNSRKWITRSAVRDRGLGRKSYMPGVRRLRRRRDLSLLIKVSQKQ